MMYDHICNTEMNALGWSFTITVNPRDSDRFDNLIQDKKLFFISRVLGSQLWLHFVDFKNGGFYLIKLNEENGLMLYNSIVVNNNTVFSNFNTAVNARQLCFVNKEVLDM